ncbi:MAG: hypothetical protein ABF289_18025 [Clostridiales bacterium]
MKDNQSVEIVDTVMFKKKNFMIGKDEISKKARKYHITSAIHELDNLLLQYKFNHEYSFLWLYREHYINKPWLYNNAFNCLEILVYILTDSVFGSLTTIERIIKTQKQADFKLFENFYKEIMEG